MNQIQKTQNQISKPSKIYFSVEQGSNYKILMTYDREEIIEFEQFQKLAQVIFAGEVQFVTINQRIVNKSTIIDISPTSEPTKKQRKARDEKRKEKESIEKRLREIGEIKSKYEREFFDRIYGADKWVGFKNPLKEDSRHLLTSEDRSKALSAYQDDNPELIEESEKLLNLLNELK